MKRFMSVLMIAIIALCFGACEDGEQSQTTVQNVENSQDDALGTSQVSSVADSSMVTTHTDSQTDTSTINIIGSGSNDESTDSETPAPTDVNGDETITGDSTTSTTAANEQQTTTKKDETTKKTTGSNGGTSSATAKTTTAKITTTTKKTTTIKTTTTKKTTTTTKTTTTKKTTTTTKKTTTTTKKTTTTTTRRTTISKTVATSFDSSTSNYSKEMFNRVNAERAKLGLPAYIYCPDFQEAADIRAREILQSFSHTRPNGTKWWTADNVEGRCLRGAENIAKGSTDVDLIMKSLMNSESHKASILSTQYTHMVVGYCDGAWVQIFVKPR